MSYHGHVDGNEGYEEWKGGEKDGGAAALEVIWDAVIAVICGEHRDRKKEIVVTRMKSLIL